LLHPKKVTSRLYEDLYPAPFLTEDQDFGAAEDIGLGVVMGRRRILARGSAERGLVGQNCPTIGEFVLSAGADFLVLEAFPALQYAKGFRHW
jgi:hypothetical protein